MALTKAQQAKKDVTQAWKRADNLAKLAGHPKKADARSFISQSDLDATILDSPDKRNPNVREAITAFKAWLAAGNQAKLGGRAVRRSKGDQNKPPRAGAPPKRQVGIRKPKTKSPTGKRQDLPAEILFDLREIQKKHDITPQDLAYCSSQLGKLLDTPIDFDNLIRQIQRG